MEDRCFLLFKEEPVPLHILTIVRIFLTIIIIHPLLWSKWLMESQLFSSMKVIFCHLLSVSITTLKRSPIGCYRCLFVHYTGHLWSILLLCTQTPNRYGRKGPKNLQNVTAQKRRTPHVGWRVGKLTFGMQYGSSSKGMWEMLNSLWLLHSLGLFNSLQPHGWMTTPKTEISLNKQNIVTLGRS